MFSSIRKWLRVRWMPVGPDMAGAYVATFATPHGQQVLHHLIDSVYCTIYNGTDPHEALAHNARRSVIHDILVNLDRAQYPFKYDVRIQQESVSDGSVV